MEFLRMVMKFIIAVFSVNTFCHLLAAAVIASAVLYMGGNDTWKYIATIIASAIALSAVFIYLVFRWITEDISGPITRLLAALWVFAVVVHHGVLIYSLVFHGAT